MHGVRSKVTRSCGGAVRQRLAQFEPNTRPSMRLDNNISGVAFSRDGSTVCANYMRAP